MAKLTVVGAGSVGSTTAYAALLRGVAETVALYDIDEARVRAEVLDLRHGSPYFPPAEVVGSADVSVAAGSDVVIVTAGAKQRPGESRLDLADRSVAIIRDLMPRLVEQAPRAVYVVVSNPVDVMTYAALAVSGLPRRQVFGSGTVLDSARLRTLLAAHAGVAPQHVHAYVIGEHGDSELPLWSSAAVGGVPLVQWPGLDPPTREAIAEQVRTAAYQIIAGKGATNFAIGVTGVEIAGAVLHDEHRIMPVSTLLTGYPDLPEVCLSVPCTVSAGGVGEPLLVPHTEEEQTALRESAYAVRRVVERLGLG